MSLVRRIAAEKRSLLLPLGVVLAMNVLIYAGIVYPLRVRAAGAEARAEAAALARATAEAGVAGAREALAGKARADAELRRFYGEVLPSDLAAARRITSLRLARLAEEAGLRYERRSSREERERGSDLARLQTTMVLEGDYSSVRRFIHALETTDEFVVIDDVSLSQSEDQRPLLLTIEVSTYFRAGGDGR